MNGKRYKLIEENGNKSNHICDDCGDPLFGPILCGSCLAARREKAQLHQDDKNRPCMSLFFRDKQPEKEETKFVRFYRIHVYTPNVRSCFGITSRVLNGL